MCRSYQNLTDCVKRALTGLLIIAFWMAPLVHTTRAAEPDLTRLVEFVKYVTPDGHLPDLCIGGKAGENPQDWHVCDACFASAKTALDFDDPPALAGQRCQSQHSQKPAADNLSTALDTKSFQSQGPPVR